MINSEVQENHTTRAGGQISQVAIHWVNLEKAPDKGFTSLADPISRYHPSWLSASWLHWEREKHQRRFLRYGVAPKIVLKNVSASAARQTIKQRAIVCWETSYKLSSPCARSTTECSTWRWRKSDQDWTLDAHAPNAILNRICHRRLEQDTEFNTFSEESEKTISNLGSIG